jgi:hypothetical protein
MLNPTTELVCPPPPLLLSPHLSLSISLPRVVFVSFVFARVQCRDQPNLIPVVVILLINPKPKNRIKKALYSRSPADDAGALWIQDGLLL